MNIPATAVLLDGRRVHGRLIHGPAVAPAIVPIFVDDTGYSWPWNHIESIDTHAAASRGGSAGTPEQNAARRINGTAPVREGRRPRGRPRKTQP